MLRLVWNCISKWPQEQELSIQRLHLLCKRQKNNARFHRGSLSQRASGWIATMETNILTCWIHPSNKTIVELITSISISMPSRVGIGNSFQCKGTVPTVQKAGWRRKWRGSGWTLPRKTWPSCAKMARWIFNFLSTSLLSCWIVSVAVLCRPAQQCRSEEGGRGRELKEEAW